MTRSSETEQVFDMLMEPESLTSSAALVVALAFLGRAQSESLVRYRPTATYSEAGEAADGDHDGDRPEH